MNDFNGLLDSSIFGFKFTSCVGQSVFTHFKEVVSEEQTSDWVLDCFHHLENVLQDSVWAFVVALNVDASDCDQQIKSGDDVGGVLNGLVQIDHSSASSEIVLEIVLEF